MTATLEAPPAHPTAGLPHRRTRPWLVLAVLGVAQLMLVLDATVVNIALPRAQAALAFSDSDRHWVVTAYSLSFGSLLLIGGRFADVFGRKRMFLVSVVGFAAASALGGLAGNFAVLVSARALQGGFGALLAPAALSLLTVTFTEPAARARAFGCFGAISAAGGSVGLMLGGALTEYAGWRWVMYVNVVIAAGALLAALRVLPAHDRRQRRAVDVPGGLLAGLGMVAIVRAVFRVVRHRDRGGAFAAIFLSATGVFGVLLYLTYYLETTLGYAAIRTGLAFLPMAVTMILVGAVGNARLGPRVAPRAMVPTALLVAGVGMAMLTRISVHADYMSAVLPATLVTAVGLGLLFAPCFSLGTAGVADADAGIASATVHVSQQIGGSVGTAMLNTIATSSTVHYAATHAAGTMSSVHARAAVHSFTVVFWVCAYTFGAAAVIVAALLNRRSAASTPSAATMSACVALQ